MKKFLFTLAAVMFAGSMFAGEFMGGGTEYFYIADTEITEAQLGTNNVQIPIKAHFDAYVSAFQVDLGTFDEGGEFIENVLLPGMTVRGAKAGADMKLTYLDDMGDENTVTPSLGKAQNNTRLIVANMEGTYWDPDGDGEYELQGVAKWAPGEYESMIVLTLAIAEDFQGGELGLRTKPTAGFDNNPEVNKTEGETAYYKSIITVEGAEPPAPQELTGEIIIGDPDEDGYVTIEYTGDEDVTIRVMIDGIYVPLTDGKVFLGAYGESVITVEVSAEGYETKTETKTVVWEEPQTPVTPEPTVNYDEETFTLTVEGEGEIHVYVNGEEVTVPYTFEQGEEDATYEVVVVAQVEGADPVTVTTTITVPGTGVTPPTPVTPEPTINFDEETLTLTVEGEGEIHVYVDGEEVTVPYTFEQGEEDATYEVVVVAQVEGAEPVTVTTTVTVPGTGVTPPPTEPTIILMLVDQYGNEVPVELSMGADGDYTTTYTFEYNPWGAFDWDPEASVEENEAKRPNVPFYFLINGVRYGADEAMRPTVLGYAMQNPLEAEAEGYYCVPVGFSYTLGVALKDGGYYVYAAVSKATGVDEVVNGKAIAGVRYFNMAGQEMQEANGVTIVVTTYTDGTTSAVKVIK